MGTTARWQHPFPELTDVPNAKIVTQAIAVALDDALLDDSGSLAQRPQSLPSNPGIRGRYWYSTDIHRLDRDNGVGWDQISIPDGQPPLLTVANFPPASSYAGQEVYLQIAEGTNWHLRKMETSLVWVAMDAVPLFASVATPESTPSATYVDLATAGPSVVIPKAGLYEIAFGAQMTSPSDVPSTSTGTAWCAPWGNGSNGPTPSDLVNGISAAELLDSSISLTVHASRRYSALLDTGQTLKLQYHSFSPVNATFSQRWLSVSPIYLS